jgi:DNA-binding response OmpR family regulator
VDAAGAACGGDALGDLLTARPSVIVLDVQLPDMHGFELCRQIKRIAALAEVPVIMLSAATMYNDPRDRVEGMLAGASSFMTKPVTMDQLWSEIESLLG